MGSTTSSMKDEPGWSEEAKRIRRDMDQTRAEMGRTIDELQVRLNPELLKEQAKDAAYDATIGRVGNMVQNAGDQIKDTGNGFVQSIKDNPLPAAIAALSIGWLFMRARSQATTTERYDVAFEPDESSEYEGIETAGSEGPSVKERIGEKTDELKERAGRVADKAQARIQNVAQRAEVRGREVSNRVQHTFMDNPLAVGLGVVAVGLAIGLALPITQKEDELMGDARDRLLDKAQQAAHGALDKASEAAHQGVDQANQRLEQTTQPNGARI
jgi:ElaB/YqjD/DUF883 family membrane-anchored ribosome-binding protein